LEWQIAHPGRDRYVTVVSMLHMYDENPDDLSPENLRRIGSNLLAKFPTILAAFHRYRQGLEPVAPRTDLTHAANYLYMLNGEEPGPRSVEGVNAYLVLLADHGFNASTFTARVVAGTQADMYGAITGAVASLKGPLHGGAPTALVKQMEEVGDPANAEKYVEDALAAKKQQSKQLPCHASNISGSTPTWTSTRYRFCSAWACPPTC